MAFSINEIVGSINALGGLAKASKFEVMITREGGQDLMYLCESATLPGVSMLTDEIKMAGYGNIEKRPYGLIFQDVQLNFMVDQDGGVIKFFHQWMQSINNFNDKTNPNGTASNSGLSPNVFAYPDEYRSEVNLFLYNESDNSGKKTLDGIVGEPQKIATYTLLEAYPLAVGDAQVDWGASDQILKLPVTMTFTSWHSSFLDDGATDANSRARANSLQSTNRTIDQKLRSVKEYVGITGVRAKPVTFNNGGNR